MARPYQRPLEAVDNGITTIVRQMDPPRYTVLEAAMLVGRSRNTLINWRKNGTYVPTEFIMFGDLKVPLYSDRDIANMRELTKVIKPGRKPRDTDRKAS